MLCLGACGVLGVVCCAHFSKMNLGGTFLEGRPANADLLARGISSGVFSSEKRKSRLGRTLKTPALCSQLLTLGWYSKTLPHLAG